MSAPAFAPGVEAQHRRIDAGNYDSIYVVGDVHGCRSTAAALLDELDRSTDDLVVFVGDLVRRGPDSPGVVDLVRSTPNVVSVRGNNEEKIITGRKPAAGLSRGDIRWLRSLPVALSWDGNVVVHGGIDPRKSLDAHTVGDLQNTESLARGDGGHPYWWEQYEGPNRVFFGHKVLSRPFVGDHAVGLDTGCVYGGPLTAYDCGRNRTVSIEADQTHKHRPDAKFLDPTRTAPDSRLHRLQGPRIRCRPPRRGQ